MAEHAKPAPAGHGAGHGDGEGTRRDFLFLAGGTMFAVGAAITAWPLINSMNPSADVLALASTEVDLAPIAEGQSITVKWRGKPVFLRHRTAAEIAEARAVPLAELRDPQTDEARTHDAAGRAAGVPDPGRRLHPPGLHPGRPEGRRAARRLRRLALPLPRVALRHRRAHPSRTRAEEPRGAAVHLPQRHPRQDRLRGDRPR